VFANNLSGLFTCPIPSCEFFSFLPRALKAHITKKHPNTKLSWKCQLDNCFYTTEGYSALISHEIERHASNFQKIRSINNMEASIPRPIIDVFLFHKQTKFSCPTNECTLTFTTSDALVRHLKDCHSHIARVIWLCSAYNCPFRDLDKRNITNHTKSECLGNSYEGLDEIHLKPLVCDICKHQSKGASDFMRHISHHPNLSFAFTTKSYFTKPDEEEFLNVSQSVSYVGSDVLNVLQNMYSKNHFKHPKIVSLSLRKTSKTSDFNKLTAHLLTGFQELINTAFTEKVSDLGESNPPENPPSPLEADSSRLNPCMNHSQNEVDDDDDQVQNKKARRQLKIPFLRGKQLRDDLQNDLENLCSKYPINEELSWKEISSREQKFRQEIYDIILNSQRPDRKDKTSDGVLPYHNETQDLRVLRNDRRLDLTSRQQFSRNLNLRTEEASSLAQSRKYRFRPQ